LLSKSTASSAARKQTSSSSSSSSSSDGRSLCCWPGHCTNYHDVFLRRNISFVGPLAARNYCVVNSFFSKDIQYVDSSEGRNSLKAKSIVALPFPKLTPQTVFCPDHTWKIEDHFNKTKRLHDSIHRIDVIIQDIDVCIQRGGDLTDLTIDKSYCFEAVIPIWYWPFASWLLKQLIASPSKRIPFKDLLVPNNTRSDPFPTLKDLKTKVFRLKCTAEHLSRVIPDIEIRALCHHPSSSSNKFDSKNDSSYSGTYDVDKVELVHSRLAAAVVDLNQSHAIPTLATSGKPAAKHHVEWLKKKDSGIYGARTRKQKS